MSLSFRAAREADIDELIAIHTRAFPDPRGYAARERNFVANPLGTLEDLWVAEVSGTMVAHAFLFPLEAWFGGLRVRISGIASLGVAPEMRGRAIGSRLVGHLHDVAASRGDAATLLYPFREGFYARLGYGSLSPYRRLRFAPCAVPWTEEMPVRAARGADRASLAACSDSVGATRTGALVRSLRAWDAILQDERKTWLVADAGGEAEGYIAWTLAQPSALGATVLIVEDIAARSGRSLRSLWAAVARQRDQVTEVRADVSEDDPLDRALIDAERPHFGAPGEQLLGHLCGGPMLRLLDPARALAARGWARPGSLVLDTGIERLALTIRDGRARIEQTAQEPDIRLDRARLASVAFGGLRAAQAARLGWLVARDGGTLALAGALLDLPPYFSADRF